MMAIMCLAQISNEFDEDTVQRQLRYTGMLETVRIRQAGYNVRLTYDEFIQLYRILLPKGLVSSQADVRDFLLTLQLNRDNYQLGSSKIFLRESEKVKLDFRLHQQIMASIVTIQRWARAILERKRFLCWREAAITIQASWRAVLAQRSVTQIRAQLAAVLHIQGVWRGYKTRTWYTRLTRGTLMFQAHARGFLARRKLAQLRSGQHEAQQRVDAHSGQSTDEAFMSKESSQEELDEKFAEDHDSQDSEESSGIQEDSETEPVPPRRANQVTRNEHRPITVGDRKTTRAKQETDDPLVIEKHSKKKMSVKRTKAIKTELNQSPYQEERVRETSESSFLSVTERKGSSDSLTSLKSIDSQTSAPVRDTLHKAKRQIQALIGAVKTRDKWEVSNSSLAQSDGEPEDPDTRVPLATDTLVWRRRQDLLPDFPNTALPAPSVVTTKVTVTRSVNVSEMSRPAMAEATNRLVTRRDGVIGEKGRLPPLKSSMSQDAGWEVPVRAARRQKVCRSVGDSEVSGGSAYNSVDGGSALLLDTIRETGLPPSSNDVSRTTLWGTRKEPRSSDGSESSYSGRLSSQEEAWSPVSPHVEMTYPKSKLPIHHITTKRSRSGGITSLDLKRRNSDPATMKLVPEPDKASDLLEWKGSTMFTIAGHRFRKITRFTKDDRCVYCDQPMDAIVTQGHKCSDCKQLFHTKCIQNGGVKEMPCVYNQGPGGGKPGRRKHRKPSRTPYDLGSGTPLPTKPPVSGKFSLTGTSQFTDRTDDIISDAKELQAMQDFITRKIYMIEAEGGKKPSEVDRVFKAALKEFKDNLVATYSIISKSDAVNIKYKDLIANFVYALQTVRTKEQTREDFPVTMGVNAFRGFMNEFMATARVEEKPSKAKRKKDKKRKADDAILYAGHTFLLTIINIPTACEICTSFFMWPIERGLVCQNCKLTCHKKCYSKASAVCGKDGNPGSNSSGVFGIPLHKMIIGDCKVPVVVDRLITTIEMYGLYTEGLYRKSGVSSKVKELKARMEDASQEDVNFENYHVHVLAAVLKSFLREMPEPLLTFDCYEDFLRAANLTDPQDRVSTLVALHEDANRMSSSSLAIVFAPCILRTNKAIPAQDSLHDIGRQTQCIETILSEQLRKVRATLADIDTLDTARHTATHRLSSLRSSKIFSPEELLPADTSSIVSAPDDEEALLMGHIQEIQKEKELLTSALPSLTRTTSDDDLLSTDMDDGSLDDVAGHIEDTEHEVSLVSSHARRPRSVPQRPLVSRSMSGGEPGGEDVGNRTSAPVQFLATTGKKLRRQSSADNNPVVRFPPPSLDGDTDEDPIMV
uniref:Uncharacterized protein n=1 Tax=Timema cristinae TaxID=61476 RepID=A0A7R9CVM3_TIMCR|nr:unnamed protein product [Timema cristinae]